MPLARVTGGTYIGKVLHKVYEDIDTSAENLLSEVERAVNQWVSGRMLAEHRKNIIDGVHLSLNTPLGPMLVSARWEVLARPTCLPSSTSRCHLLN
jgi:hypothetical protein